MGIAPSLVMPAVVQNHIVVRELGTPWTSRIAEAGRGVDETVVLLQQGDETPRELEARFAHRVQRLERGERLRSAVIACNASNDPQTLRVRYRIARRVLKYLRKSGESSLTLVLDDSAPLVTMLRMCRRLVRDVAAKNVAFRVACGAQLISV